MSQSNSDTERDKERKAEVEEREIIDTNLLFVEQFLKKVEDRGNDLSSESLNKIEMFKLEWGHFFNQGVKNKPTVEAKVKGDKLGKARAPKKDKPKVDKSKGAYPKFKKELSANSETDKDYDPSSESGSEESNNISVGSTSSEQSNTDESSEEVSSGVVEKHKKRKSKKKSTKNKESKKENFEMENLIKVMGKLDTRKVPPQEKFDESSGESLKRYLTKFERYCTINFKGEKDLWIGELERHLSGKILEAYKIEKDVNDSYKSLKNKLIDWYDNSRELRMKKNKDKFRKANYIRGESFYLYSSRLEKLYKVAYPQRSANSSQQLREKYISTVPKAFKKSLQTQVLATKLKNNKITWKTIQKMARLQDVEMEKEDSEDKEMQDEVVINLGKKVVTDNRGGYGKKFRDAATQDDRYALDNNEKRVNYSKQLNHSNQEPSYRDSSKTNSNQRIFNNQNSSEYSNNDGGNMQYGDNRRQIFSRPPQNLWNNIVQCGYCHRLGHTTNDCRTRWNTCYICGSGDHQFRQCGVTLERFNGDKSRFDNNRGGFNNYGGSSNNAGRGDSRSHGFDGRGSYNGYQGTTQNNRSLSQPPFQRYNTNNYRQNNNYNNNRRNSNENNTRNNSNLN